VRVESNDPDSPITNLTVEALVNIDSGEEDFSLDMGNVRANAETKKMAYIDIGKAKKFEVTKVESSSPFITASEILTGDPTMGRDSIDIELTVAPGIPTGLLSEKVVIHFKDDLRPRANFFLYGIVVEDIEVSPLVLQFNVGNPDLSKTLTITNYIEDFPLEITGVDAPGNLMKTSVKALEAGRKFEITVTPTEELLSLASDQEGSIKIKTNNPQNEVVEVPFRVKIRQ